ncbi:MAG: class I SAM-dependent DNA methyltransferase [Bacteroidetes bacterium]|nr:class I SAM-dependent DNA methyltransferase [Bacteroidota bacterium]MBU1679240.1 class I SAM-dependent DNA methyltransferase [Bacteroidota bacterium]
MVLSWNEIRKRSIEFSKDWESAKSEISEKQTFWNEFFNVFGISRKRVATYEKSVDKISGYKGFVDLFWPSLLLVEHKSLGENLDKAFSQSIDYTFSLKDRELPKYVIVSDFERIRLYDLEENTQSEFHLKDFHKNIQLFGFIAGYRKKTYDEEDPANIEAAELMGKLHDKLFDSGYKGHELEIYLVRILFCLFADDTGIFEKGIFHEFIENKTDVDGANTGAQLESLFEVLNTPKQKRFTTIDDDLNAFEYVNGQLFAERLTVAAFNSEMREALLACCAFDWSKISPAIFGSLFQSVMDKELRRSIGAHYTTEQNILKLIKPLFLDELQEEFESAKNNRKKLLEFHSKIANLKFLDPACGCGNFLVITYRELRLLELEILKRLHKNTDEIADFRLFALIDVDCMYGIEIEEFPARIAEVALWLVDHQMNIQLSEAFGKTFIRLPLKKAATIINGNALRLKWEEIISPTELNYILGNPPFVGKQFQTLVQNSDMELLFNNVNGSGVLDYVSGWYMKAAKYIQGTLISVGFVSTNSISQGEQVGILWNELGNKFGIRINFAHRTFKWSSEARGKANVYVVIIGFALFDKPKKRIFDYEHPNSEAHELIVKNINPYLVNGPDVVILKRKKTICKVNEIVFGNMPNDGGNLLLTDDEKEELLGKEPEAAKFIRRLISAKEYLNNVKRWCLWLVDIKPEELRNLPEIKLRVAKVKEHRLSSSRAATRKLADFPTLFGELRQPDNDYIFIPLTTSENRNYIPMSFFSKNEIVNNTCSIIPNASLFEFGILMSKMHMVWIKHVCGRLEGRYRYSNEVVYNNFPWPPKVTKQQKIRVIQKGQKVLTTRNKFVESSLADLYDSLAMPPALVEAHKELDKAVDACYRSQAFPNDSARIEYLFELYNNYTNPLNLGVAEKRKKK